jgi:formylglycine-generating enzyme required for sulfatase activity
MTGRPEYFTQWQPDNTSITHLVGLSSAHRTRLATQIYANRSSVPLESAAYEAQRLTEFLNQFTPQLSSNPRFVALLSTVYPAKRGILYRRLIDLLLDNWTQPSPGLPSIMEIFQHAEMSVAEAEAQLIETLGQVAYETVDQFPDSPPRGETLRSSVLHHLGDLGAYFDLNPERVRAYLSENASVLVGSGDNFRFAHEDFRQYFLAEHLLKEIERAEQRSADPHPLVRDLMWNRPRIWADPLTMISDLLVDESHGSLNRVWDLIEDLIGDNPPDKQESSSSAAHAEAVWLAARIAVEQGLGTGRLRRSERDILDNLVAWLIALLESPDALVLDNDNEQISDCNRRAEMGRLLGTLGDTRPGTGLPIGWVTVPAGPAIISGSHPDDPYAPNHSLPRQQIDLPAFQIGRYPVTYAQYEAFVDVGGYQERAYWVDGEDDSGWAWLDGREHPAAGWLDPRWHVPNHPVIGVTWYEAAAFCRWLSAQSGALIRLPTIAEWIRAARGASDSIFPYGNNFDVAGGNTHLSGIGRTVAVGIFPRGRSAYGVYDLSGNVYEWCDDAVQETRLDGKPLLHRALISGSWNSYPGFCRIDAVYSDHPAFATTYWGFRVTSHPT